MKIIHIMKDGTMKDSIGGKIPDGEFYRVLQTIIEKRKRSNHGKRT